MGSNYGGGGYTLPVRAASEATSKDVKLRDHERIGRVVKMASTVKELEDLVVCLSDRDGSCRDVNFATPTWTGVRSLLARLENDFARASGTNQEGQALAAPLPDSVVQAAQSNGSAHVVFNEGVAILRHVQVFACAEDDGSPFVELTFFPDDLQGIGSVRSEFITWVQELQGHLDALTCFVRYESAGWRLGDVEDGSGVFLVSEIPAISSNR